MSLGQIAQLGATGAGGFYGGPAGAAGANAAVGALQGNDLKQLVFNAGLAAGVQAGGEALFGAEKTVLADAPGFTEAAKAGFPIGPDAVMTPRLPNAGQSVGSFDVLGVPTSATTPFPRPISFSDRFDKTIRRASDVAILGQAGQQLFAKQPFTPLPQPQGGQFQPISSQSTSPFLPVSLPPSRLFSGRRLFG